MSSDVIIGLRYLPKNIKHVDRDKYKSFNIWEATEIKKFEKLPIWTHSVYVNLYSLNNRFVAQDSLQIGLEVVNEFGDVVEGGDLSASAVLTDLTGFNTEPIYFVSTVSGVFRVKATYNDNNTSGVSYSPPIIVME